MPMTTNSLSRSSRMIFLAMSAIGLVVVAYLAAPYVLPAPGKDFALVKERVMMLGGAIAQRNATEALAFYANASVITVTGNSTGLDGTFRKNAGEMVLFYSTLLGHSTSINESVSNLSVYSSGTSTAVATFTLSLGINSEIVGPIYATVVVHQNWTFQSKNWLIEQDNWNFTRLLYHFAH
jgi:hypothetical protein